MKLHEIVDIIYVIIRDDGLFNDLQVCPDRRSAFLVTDDEKKRYRVTVEEVKEHRLSDRLRFWNGRKWNENLKMLDDLLRLTDCATLDALLWDFDFERLDFSLPSSIAPEFTRLAGEDELWLVGLDAKRDGKRVRREDSITSA